MWAALYEAHAAAETGSEGALDPAGLADATFAWAAAAAAGTTGFALLAAARGAPLGFVACTMWNRGWSRQGSVGHVNALWVVPSRRRQGLGTRLAEAAIAELRHRGAAVIEVDALASNPGAVRFWACRGFSEKATVFRFA